MLRDDLLRRRMQIPRSAVIPQPGPEFQHFLLRCGCERIYRRETFQKAIVVGHHRGDARLLQHDFRHPDAIRIAAAAPGKIALVRAKPSQEAFLKLWQCAAGEIRLHAADILAWFPTSDIAAYSLSRKIKYEEDHKAVGMVCCGRAVIMILKISCSLARSSRNLPPVAEMSGWIVASSRSAS